MTEAAIAPTDTGEATAAPVDGGQAGDNGQPASWYDSATDEVKGYIQNKGWDTDPLKAVTSYQELEKFRGADETQLIKLPKDLSEEGALDAVYDRLGRPEDAKGYKVEGLPEGVSLDEQRLEAYSQIAHQVGLSSKQFEALAKADAEYWMQVETQVKEHVEREQKAQYDALMQEWGSNASEREELARRGLSAVLPEGVDKKVLANAIEETVGTAVMLKMFANIGDRLGKEHSIHDSGDTKPFGYTKEQAAADKAQLMAELQGDKARLAAYNSNTGTDVAKMRKLNEILAG